MSVLQTMVRREISSYVGTPLALIFMVVFLFLSASLTFYLGNFYESNQADLRPFFAFHPWLYLFFIPAIGMRLWAEERKSGTIELLLTLPIHLWQAVLAKFLAAWLLLGATLLCTFPIWLTVNYLGDPDNGTILAAYIGSFLMAGGYLSVMSFVSAMTCNQVVAFVIGVTLCFLLTLTGYSLVLDFLADWLPDVILDAIASISILSHFQSISKGVLDLRDLVYFMVLMAAGIVATMIIIEAKKGD